MIDTGKLEAEFGRAGLVDAAAESGGTEERLPAPRAGLIILLVSVSLWGLIISAIMSF
jgi:hypothetical protein